MINTSNRRGCGRFDRYRKLRKTAQRVEASYIASLDNPNVFGLIYKITIQSTGKIYIGQTKNGLWQRVHRHITDAISDKIHLTTHFANAIRKHGYKTFKVEVIDHEYGNETELTKRERYWIKKLDSTNPKIGYNETAATNRCGGNTYASKTESELDAIRSKISSALKGSNNGNSSAIKARSNRTGEILHFPTVVSSMSYFNVDRHITISRRCSHKIKAPLYGEWEFAYEDREFGENEIIRSNRYICNSRKISVIDLSTGIELTFKSYREFERC